MIDISVIVPVYNVEKYLVDCIESILHQTFQGNYEVILVDDGSTDGSGEICDRYSEQCKVIHQPNRGVSAARNVGIRTAQGQYISFVDSDDTLREYALEVLWRYVVEYPNVDVVKGAFEDTKGAVFLTKRDISYSNDRKDFGDSNIWSVLGYTVFSKLIRRDVVLSNNVYFDEELDCGEDVLWLYSLQEYINSIAWRDEVIYNYNVNNLNSIIRGSHEVRNYIDSLKVIEIIASKYSKERVGKECFVADTIGLHYLVKVWPAKEHKRLRQAACHTYKELRRCQVGFYLCYKAWLLTVPLPPKVTFWLSRPLTRLLRACFE